MCGLFGTAAKSFIDQDKCLSALNMQEHRGPDQFGIWSSDNIFIGHRRLSILDLSDSGRQPMQSNNVIITVNGEIYNYKKLRDELIDLGYVFSSNSDSEVVLHGYKAWGIKDLLIRIDGMYSVQILDLDLNKIYLARDRYGIKPLYYAVHNEQISWASELKSIVTYIGQEKLELDNTAIYDYLTYLYVPTPKTLYKNVFKLPPATIVEFSLSELNIELHKYWELTAFNSIDDNIDTAKVKIKSLIQESVNEQMVSDVPVGFFLSGGVDSSVVVASAAGFNNSLHTFSIGFDDDAHNETEFADVVARKFNCKHRKTILSVEDVFETFSNLVTWYDEPFADTSAFPSYLVSKIAREEVTVALTGDGGDEVFGGYHWYKIFNEYREIPLSGKFGIINRFVYWLKSKISGYPYKILDKIHRVFVMDDLELYTKLLGGLTRSEKVLYAKKLGIPNDYDDYWYFRKFYKVELPIRTRLQYLDFNTYLPDDILTKVDRVSMAVSLECRIPLLKKEIVEYAFSVKENVRYFNGELKGVLKYAFRFELPDEILFRRKKGFSIPVNSWKEKIFSGYRTKQEAILKSFLDGIE